MRFRMHQFLTFLFQYWQIAVRFLPAFRSVSIAASVGHLKLGFIFGWKECDLLRRLLVVRSGRKREKERLTWGGIDLFRSSR